MIRRACAFAVLAAGALCFDALPASAALTAERIAFHPFEDGPVLAANHVFLPGETVFFSCRWAGYEMAAGADEQRSMKLAWRMQVTDPAGVPIVTEASGRIAEQVLAQDKNWYPKFLQSWTVPTYAISGSYRVKVLAKDEVSGKELTSTLDFQVRGHAVEPSETLAGRNLHFLRSEVDGPPLDPASYHPGQVLWARFDMTGYKFGEKNRYSVEYGLVILRETPLNQALEQVFAQPAAAADSSASYYPQRYVPGALSLNLDPNVPEGNYTLVVTMEDKLSGQKAETRGAFRIEK